MAFYATFWNWGLVHQSPWCYLTPWSSNLLKYPCRERSCEMSRWRHECGKNSWLAKSEEQWRRSSVCYSGLSRVEDFIHQSYCEWRAYTGLRDMLAPPRVSRPRALEQDYHATKSDLLISQVKKKKKSKDFLKVTFCGQSGTVPGAHNDGYSGSRLLAVSSGRQELRTHSLGAHPHSPRPLMIAKWGEACMRVSQHTSWLSRTSSAVTVWWKSHSTQSQAQGSASCFTET